jgi:glycosyltransferase involved in cell wall biosynthesis
VLVLPTSGAFDSRTYRIASTVAARGHSVTVVARADDRAAVEEMHPAGYRIVRVAVDPVDALPFAGVIRRVLRRRPSTASAAPPSSTGRSPTTATAGIRGRVRRAFAGARRLAAIGLTIRSQVVATRRAAPVGDVYHGMAYMGIPVALSLRRGRPAAVVYDARDIYLEARNLARLPGPARWAMARVERRWAHRATRVVTTNDAYADVLATRLDVPRPLVVMNCSMRYVRPDPRARRFHDRLGLAVDRRVVLYHGGLFPERGIEQLFDAIESVPNAELVLMGYGVLEDALRTRIAASDGTSRVHLLPAVPPEELHDWVAAADVVAMPIQPTTLNHRLTTPNKLFEAMAAGVPVVASDLPGMASIVTETGCGVLCDPVDPASIAAAIRSVIDAPADVRQAMAERAARAADETYNWEAQVEALLAEYGRLTGRPW